MKASAEGRTSSLCLHHPADDQWLLRRDREAIALQVDAKTRELFAVRPRDLRSRRVLSVSLRELPTLIIEKQSVTEKLVRTERGHRLQSPVVEPPDPLALGRLRRLLAHLNVERFVSSQQARAALKQPDVVLKADASSVSLDPADIERFSQLIEALVDALRAGAMEMQMEIGGQTSQGGCYGRLDRLTFVLAKKACETLRAPLVNRRVFPNVLPHQVASLKICRHGSCLELNKKNGRWTPPKGRGSGDLAASQSTINTAVSALVRLRAVQVLSYQPDPELRSSSQRVCVTLRGTEAVQGNVHADAVAIMTHCVRVAKEKHKVAGHPVRRLKVEKQPIVYAVPATVIRRIFRPLGDAE
jgi:hypothetical protein